MRAAAASIVAGVTAAAVARRLVPAAIAHVPRRLVRTNVNGAHVPAVLGAPLVAGALTGLASAAATSAHGRRTSGTAAVVILVTAAGGLLDDARGDEAARGFRGHLGALVSGRVTGGTLKMISGALAGAAAGAAHSTGRERIETAAAVALGANVVNLLDRAPGRAAKVACALGAPLTLFGERSWRPVGAASLGALVACTPADLAERGMLGDAGANALGAVLGLSLTRSQGPRARRATIVALALLTAASERWSFSDAIERVPALRAFDSWGRAPRAGGAT